MSKTITMTVGLPGSGKSTWALEMLADNPGNVKRVNKDDLRALIDGGKWSRDNEKFVLEVRDSIIVAALQHGKHIIVDDTNFAPPHRERLKTLARENGAEFKVQDFTHVSIETCIERDLKRQNSVGEAVIRKMWKQYLAPKPPVIPYDPNKPSVYICDLDGTLCLMNGRGPYEGDKCDTDLPNMAVVRTIQNLMRAGEQVIFASGRYETVREKSISWLKQYVFTHVPACTPILFMRADGDSRQDAVIKAEIYERYIKPNWNIVAVFDDRARVVEGWRQLGLTVFQVAEGEF